MQLLYSTLKYMQIKFHRESNQIEVALLSSIATLNRFMRFIFCFLL